MALEPVFGRGARGDIVRQLQLALTQQQVPHETTGKPEAALAQVDGDFGRAMQRAVERVQAANGFPVTGVVNRALWKFLTADQPWPDHFSRLVRVCAGFEGHGYTWVSGNHDGAGMTWGLIGFALVSKTAVGGLPELLRSIYQAEPAEFKKAFGEQKTKLLVDELKLDWATEPRLDRAKLLAFAKLLSLDSGRSLVPGWQQAFEALGTSPKVQAIQRRRVEIGYYGPAMAAAKKYVDDLAMDCERTQLFFLDIHINNGSLSDVEDTEARAAIASLTDPSTTQKLMEIHNAMVRHRAKKDVIRQRKSCIAMGSGMVGTGRFFRLDAWGIDLSEPAPALTWPLSYATVLLDTNTIEAVSISNGIGAVKLAPEPAAAAVAASALAQGKLRFPGETGFRVHTGQPYPTGSGAIVQTEFASKGAAVINSKMEQMHDAFEMLFRGRPALLAISGQYVQTVGAAKGDVNVLQYTKKTWAGIALKQDDRLLAIRQRADGYVDITGVRRHLAECQLLILYLSSGIPGREQPGTGPRWLQWLAAVGAKPLVLGWSGPIRPPSDGERQSVASEFFARLAKIAPGDDLPTLCATHADAVVQCWGESCHAAFAKGKQRHLWREQLFMGPGLPLSGAGAIGRNGEILLANALYDGTPGTRALVGRED